jgi:hypothetical protein
MLREPAINDDGPMLIRELDHEMLQHDTAATDATHAPRPARPGLLFDRGPGYVPRSDGAYFADVSWVAA